jgi:peptidoglycan hydrolase-like protein with peptidoglycan-binding domain
MTLTVSKTISDEQLNKIIQIESGGRPDAQAKTSTALGLGQFLNSTWLGVVRKHRPDWIEGRTTNQVLALRTVPDKSIEMLARFTEDNAKFLGPGWQEGDLYLAHFLGTGDAAKLLRAPSTDLASQHVSANAVRANRNILENKTVRQVREWAATKMAKAGGHGWIAKYWVDGPGQEEVIPEDAEPVRVDPEDSELPADPTPHGATSDAIANYQKALVAMGYNEVGLIDGSWGGATAGAIAAFLNDHGISRAPDLSEPNVTLIMKEHLAGYKRPLAEVRTNVTTKELAKTNVTMLTTLRTQATAFWGMVTGGAAFGFNAVASQFQSVWTAIEPLRKVMGAVPVFVWIMLFIGICGFLWWNSRKAATDTKDAFAERRLLR